MTRSLLDSILITVYRKSINLPSQFNIEAFSTQMQNHSCLDQSNEWVMNTGASARFRVNHSLFTLTLMEGST